VQSYQWLIKIKASIIYNHYSRKFGFDLRVSDAAERLTAAIAELEKDRNVFLDRLRAFDRKRCRAKTRGRRTPTKAEHESLYKMNEGFWD
jgi:hypothetical protein